MPRENTIVFFPGQHALGEVSYAFLQLILTSPLDDGQFLVQGRDHHNSNIVTLCGTHWVQRLIWLHICALRRDPESLERGIVGLAPYVEQCPGATSDSQDLSLIHISEPTRLLSIS